VCRGPPGGAFNPIRNFRIFIGQTLPISSLPNIRIYIWRISVIDPFTLRSASGPIIRAAYVVCWEGVDELYSHTHIPRGWRKKNWRKIYEMWLQRRESCSGRLRAIDRFSWMDLGGGPLTRIKRAKKKSLHLVPNCRVPRPQKLVKWSFTFSQGDGFASPTQHVYIYNTHHKVRNATTGDARASILAQPYRTYPCTISHQRTETAPIYAFSNNILATIVLSLLK